MAWFQDLSPCSYFGEEWGSFLRAVGWLERGKPFPVGSVQRQFYDKLVELLNDPWQPVVAAGHHVCDLCQFEGEERGGENVFIPGSGVLYVCPELIVHYMNAHHYAPPAEFCDAVLSCPPTRSMEYRRAMLANGGRALLKRAAS